MDIKVKHLMEAFQAMREFSGAMLPHAVDSMGTDHDFYKIYREHADRLATVGAYLKVHADMAIKDVKLEIEHD